MQVLPYSAAAENNKAPILAAIRDRIAPGHVVLEIGSGSGQHAVHFASAMPSVTWIPSEQPSAMAGLRARLNQAGLSNVAEPLVIDVLQFPALPSTVDDVFSANTAHIMSWEGVASMFAAVAAILESGIFALYGPFHRDGVPTSPGNAEFDHSLRSRDPAMGIRDDRDLAALASGCGLALVEDIAMPANNRLLIWRQAAAHRDGASVA